MCSKSWRKKWQCALACGALGLLAGSAGAQDTGEPMGELDPTRPVEVLIPDQGLTSRSPGAAAVGEVPPPVAPLGEAAPAAETVPIAEGVSAQTVPVAESLSAPQPAPAFAPAPAPAASTSAPAPAASKVQDDGWATVGKDDTREVQLDRGGIIDSDAGTKVAWVRINMLSDDGQDYAAIKAMNRFDCNSRSFITLKRVYLNARHHILREETVKDEAPVFFSAGSMDERLWREVCEQGSSSSDGGGAAALQDVAARVEQALAAAGARAVRGADGSTIVRMGGDDDAKPQAAPRTPKAPRASAQAGSYAGGGSAEYGRDAPLCRRGRQQAPIDIIERGTEYDAEPIAFDYRPVPFRVAVSKQEVRLNLSAQGQPSELFYAGKRYQLAQVSLRMPGTRINARQMALDVQLLHKAVGNGAALMLVVPMVVGEYGESPVLEQILAALPARITRSVTLPGSGELDLPSLIPFDGSYDRYQGSLTEAPCTEDVAWLVMRSPMVMSVAQLAQLQKKFPTRLGRAAQPANGRTVLTYR